jgi:hypothetical protein
VHLDPVVGLELVRGDVVHLDEPERELALAARHEGGDEKQKR